jgi:hypothetical protein
MTSRSDAQSNEVVAAMDAETLEALRGSIAKWERVVADNIDGTYWKDCPLCLTFWDRGCVGCPVSERTGKFVCRGSPFAEYDQARSDAIDRESKDPERDPAVMIAARKELEFLKSLLPPEAVTALDVSEKPR